MKKTITSKGFTLIELLVVIAIIAVLLSVLIPALRVAKEQARKVVCMAQLGQIGLALESYETNYNYKRFVMRKDGTDTDGYWWGKLAPYFQDSFEADLRENKVIKVLMCPSAPETKYDTTIQAPAGTTTGYWGTSTRPWGWTRTNGSTIGSYTINGWIAYDQLYDQAVGREEFMYRSWLNVPSGVPIFGCGRWTAAWPMGDDAPPTNLDAEENATNNSMGRFCIARHRRAINLIFKDLHVSPTQELEQLWQFRWHKNYVPPATRVELPNR